MPDENEPYEYVDEEGIKHTVYDRRRKNFPHEGSQRQGRIVEKKKPSAEPAEWPKPRWTISGKAGQGIHSSFKNETINLGTGEAGFRKASLLHRFKQNMKEDLGELKQDAQQAGGKAFQAGSRPYSTAKSTAGQINKAIRRAQHERRINEPSPQEKRAQERHEAELEELKNRHLQRRDESNITYNINPFRQAAYDANAYDRAIERYSQPSSILNAAPSVLDPRGSGGFGPSFGVGNFGPNVVDGFTGPNLGTSPQAAGGRGGQGGSARANARANARTVVNNYIGGRKVQSVVNEQEQRQVVVDDRPAAIKMLDFWGSQPQQQPQPRRTQSGNMLTDIAAGVRPVRFF